MTRDGRPKKYSDPKEAQRQAKKRYRNKKRLERQRTNNPLVISYRCKQCGLEVKENLMAKSNPHICVWCEYDNKHPGKRVTIRK